MKELTELTSDASVAPWVPTQAWADLILEASVCYGQLSGVITAVDYDLAAGNGNVVIVRSFPARTAQGGTGWHSGCTCLSAVSSSLATYGITICQYGDYDKMCGWSLWKAKGPVKEGILNEMAKGLASARDLRLWTALAGAAAQHNHTAVTCVSRATDTCCNYRYNLFNSIVSMKAIMEDACYNPDTVILNPTVAAWFYTGDNGGEMRNLIGGHLKFDSNDNLISIAGLKVIETGLAATCASTASAVMAIVIDSSRAVGEAWGKRPTFSETYVPECDYYKEVVWMWWGANTLDVAAIGHIRNP